MVALAFGVRPELAFSDQPKRALERAVIGDNASVPQRPLDEIVSDEKLGFSSCSDTT